MAELRENRHLVETGLSLTPAVTAPPTPFESSNQPTIDTTISSNPSSDSSSPPINDHPMVTRSKSGVYCTKTFPDYHVYYSTKHPLCALYTHAIPIEPSSYTQAVKFK